MSTRLLASGGVELMGAPAAFGYPAEPPVAYLVSATQMNAENGHSIEEGRFHSETGEIRGVPGFLRQDTYIDGTPGRSGIAFDIVSGDWVDDYKEPIYNTYGLHVPDCAPGTVYEATSTDNFDDGIPDCDILLRRGFPGVSATDADYAADACYTYLTWGYPNTFQYRLMFKYGWPLGLQFSKNAGASWFNPQQLRRLGTLEKVLEDHNHALRMQVYIDRVQEVFRVEFGNGETLRWGLPTDYRGELLRAGKLRVESKNGWFTLNIWPSRHSSVRAIWKPRDFGRPLSQLQNAKILPNATGTTPAGQETTHTLTVDGTKVGVEITATLPDAGEGKGSERAPVLSDATLYIPGVWTYDIDGLPDFRTVSGAYKRRDEWEHFDPVIRLFRQRARVCLSNGDGQLNDMVGDLAVRVYGNTGSGNFLRMTGMARNPGFDRADPTRLYWMDVRDKWELLEKGIGQIVRLDGWCVYSAVRFVAEICGIHPTFLWRIPDYPPGRAGYDCPYPILESGVGSSPKHEYLPNVSGASILLELVQDQNLQDPTTGRVVSFYTGFDTLGDLLFEPLDLLSALPKWAFSDLDPSGQGQIIDKIHWDVSTDNIRTDIIQQGLDIRTNDLLHKQRQVSVQARRLRGTRVPLFDSSPRYGSEEQMDLAADAMTIPASIPELTGAFRAPAVEHLHAGDVVYVNDYFHRVADWFVIEKLHIASGTQDVTGLSDKAGFLDVWADYLVRALVNYY